ncbi:Monoxygenase [Modestobacter italicus]|uniref:Monoxygenase n=2 Tax=Modestobacter italicus (strain DSM 44449 / CECT 9708 / BC 501) TaxID=2732864 RepID=I4EU76_MODI5|nr:Monoxygenase [Modestobacter marinus]
MGPGGVTGGSWRHPDDTSAAYLTIEHWTGLARRFEDAGLDFLFLADSYGYPTLHDRVIDLAVADAINFPAADPVVLVSAIAAATSRLGVVVTASTTVDKPQVLARRFATLDHLTRGRIGWNIVTGAAQASSARLFGEQMMPHDERYAMAEDSVQLALKLWETSWEDDALRLDKAGGVHADPAKVHEIDHEGPYFRAHGLLTVPPSPQRTPLLFQAGTSGRGRDFAATYAESVFLAGGDPDHVAANIADIRRRAVGYGREPDAIKFLVGAMFVTAPTEAAAQAERQRMLDLSTLENAAAAYAFFTGLDLLAMDLDGPLTGRTQQGQSSVDRFTGANGAPVATVRQVLEDHRRNGVNGTVFVGEPEHVVDQAEAFVQRTGADGFLVQPYVTPGTYDDLIDLVLPVMRARGLAKEAYEGATLRAHLFGAGRDRLPASHVGRRTAPERAAMV